MRLFKMLQRFVLLLVGYALPSIAMELVNTPYGPFPSECVHGHPSGTLIEETQSGFRATHPDGTVKAYPRKKVCLDHAKTMRMQPDTDTAKPSNTAYASLMFPEQITEFTSTYLVPANPVQQDKWFALWIGLQDPRQANTVLQPVLVHNGPAMAWGAQSWHCCPSGEASYASPVYGAQPGDRVYGAVQWTATDRYTITTTWKGQSSVLNTKTSPESVFNWALALLEPQTVASCDDLPIGDMVFGDLSLSTAGGPITPSWTKLNSNSCISDIVTSANRVILEAGGN